MCIFIRIACYLYNYESAHVSVCVLVCISCYKLQHVTWRRRTKKYSQYMLIVLGMKFLSSLEVS